MFFSFSGVKSGAAEDEPVCEECSQTRNLIHCIDASIQVRNVITLLGLLALKKLG